MEAIADAEKIRENCERASKALTKEDHGGDGYFVKSGKMPTLKGGSQMRFNPNRLENIKKVLSESAISAIKELGFGTFLNISLSKLPSVAKPLVECIALHCKIAMYKNKKAIVLDLHPNRPLVLTAEVLGIIHGLPRGKATVSQQILDWPDATQIELKDAFKKHEAAAAAAAADAAAADDDDKEAGEPRKKSSGDINHVAAAHACKAASEAADTKLEVRIFLASVLSFVLFTTSSNYVTTTNMEYILNINKIATSDWCELLFDHMIDKFSGLLKSRSVMSPMSFLTFFLDNLDINGITTETPRLEHLTEKQVEYAVELLKQGCKLKKWEDTVYGCNGIPEVRPEEITYIDINTEHNHKKRNRIHQTHAAKEGNNKDLNPFQEEDNDDYFVRVPRLKKLVAPSFEQLPTYMAKNVKDIIEQCQSSWLQCVEKTTEKHVKDCGKALSSAPSIARLW